MGSCISCQNISISKYDNNFTNPMYISDYHNLSYEAEELLEQITDEILLELKYKMPSVPTNKIIL
jgi:hypothetical protein